MTCDEALDLALDGGDDSAKYHVGACPKCAADFDDLRLIRSTLAAHQVDKSDAEIFREIRERLAVRIAARPLFGRLRWAVASCLAVVTAAASLWPSKPDGPPPTPIALALPAPPVQTSSPAHRPPPKPIDRPRAAPAEPNVQVAGTVDTDPNRDLLLQVKSSNPDVLIYWLVEPAGD